MTAEQTKTDLKFSLQAFASGNFTSNALSLFQALGYVTERQAPLHRKTKEEFRDTFISSDKRFDETKARFAEWKYVDLLFQLSKEEVLKQTSLFDTKKVDSTVIETYLFFAIELSKEQYSRTELSLITREVNRLFPMPAMILFRHGSTLTLSVINRRLHKKDESKDVLEKVTLIKDISIADPHRAHLEILYDLSFDKLKEEVEFTNFVELHNGWRDTLNIKALNDKFYKDIANWFFWACKKVEFPDDDEYYQNRDTRNSENVIRLLTRIIFCWFMKEKGLIKDELFKENEVEKLLNADADKTGSTYYKAILQNLFFATLNIPVKNRKFISDKTFQGKNKNHFDHSVFRYKRFFKPNAAYLKFFKDIPFLNGGLFECQDYKITTDKGKEETIRIDCFSDNPKNETRLKVPDEIFFGKGSHENWLNDIFGTKNQEYTVKGIFRTLNEYKFTIQENTPLEEEIALDPDLLGIVFENLLASYNPETRETARKQTGSFYTPREIVNYMVDESIVAYIKNKIANVDEAKLRTLLSATEKEVVLSITEKEKLIDAIDTIKIIDPACGSGAFPMGILQKLVHLLHKLDSDNKLWKQSILARTPVEIRKETEQILKTKSADYIRKLGLIQNCIYGVDIQPIAVEISKLRFFLSLLVDFDKTENADDNWGIEPLPNLDFKIMQGNSLVEEFNGVSLKMKPDESSGALNFVDEELHKQIVALHEKQGLFLRETLPSKKKDLKEEVNEKLIDIFHYHLKNIKATYFNELKKIEENSKRIGNKQQGEQYYEAEKTKADKKFGFNYQKFEKDLKQLISGKKPRNFFPYSLFFADVFESNGFDIVIGNPPYGIVFDIQLKELYEKLFPTFKRNNDVYVAFMEDSISHLKEKGILAFITPNTYLNGDYFKVLRSKIREKTKVNEIVDFKNSKIFQDPTVFVAITIFQKDKTRKFPYNSVIKISNEDFSKTDAFQIQVSEINDSPLKPTNSLIDKIISSYPKSNFYSVDERYFVKDVGFNYWSIGKGKKRDGDSIGDRILYSGTRMNKKDKSFLKGKDIDKYFYSQPKNYLKHDFANYLEDGVDIFRYSAEFLEISPKIIYRQTSNKIIAAIDYEKNLCDKTVHIIVPKDKSESLIVLLALLNSKLFDYFYKDISQELEGRTFAQVKTVYIKQLPILKISSTTKNQIEQIVNYILLAKQEKSTTLFFERLIDAIVYDLYLHESMQKGKCEVLKHLGELPELKDDNDLKTVEKIYAQLSNSRPLKEAFDRMDGVEEIRIIEGKQ